MLILTRRVQESLMIGDHVTVTVLGVKGNQVRIGVDAPANVQVDREEVHLRKLLERNSESGVHFTAHKTLEAPVGPNTLRLKR